jgi:hypothetical protein
VIRLVVWFATFVVLPLGLIEISELAPWLARKVVVLGVLLIKDRGLREQYKEDWQEGVEAWPGRLLKLVRALLLVGIGVPKTNWYLFDEWWQREIGARVSIAVLTRSAQVTFYCPPFLRALEPPEARAEAVAFNRALTELCRMIRTADPAVRAEALSELELLAQKPPPWVPAASARLDERTTLRKLGQALKLRGDA